MLTHSWIPWGLRARAVVRSWFCKLFLLVDISHGLDGGEWLRCAGRMIFLEWACPSSGADVRAMRGTLLFVHIQETCEQPVARGHDGLRSADLLNKGNCEGSCCFLSFTFLKDGLLYLSTWSAAACRADAAGCCTVQLDNEEGEYEYDDDEEEEEYEIDPETGEIIDLDQFQGKKTTRHPDPEPTMQWGTPPVCLSPQ